MKIKVFHFRHMIQCDLYFYDRTERIQYMILLLFFLTVLSKKKIKTETNHLINNSNEKMNWNSLFLLQEIIQVRQEIKIATNPHYWKKQPSTLKAYQSNLKADCDVELCIFFADANTSRRRNGTVIPRCAKSAKSCGTISLQPGRTVIPRSSSSPRTFLCARNRLNENGLSWT